MNIIVFLLDSLNRSYLSCYGNKWVQTPNIERLANRCFVFNRHYFGSAPCIPARRELFTGRKEFLWRGWGQTEPFDSLLPIEMAKTGMATAAITDHYHYWDASDGYGYLQSFQYFDMIRGAENDRFGLQPEEGAELPQWVASTCRYRNKEAVLSYYRNTLRETEEENYQSPRTMKAAAEWLKNRRGESPFFLWVESFDPHEPFRTPEPYRSMYGPYTEEYTCWPPYQKQQARKDFVANAPQAEVEFTRQQYAAKLTMADHHLGKVLDVLDEKNLWDDTMVILTTDHGHELFEKEEYGKHFPHWNTQANIPMMIWHPRYPGGGKRIDAFTTTVDVYATLLDAAGSNVKAPDGRSMLPLIDGSSDSIRDYVLFGSFGSGACLADGQYTYYCGFDNRNPLYWYSTHMRRVGKARLGEAQSGFFIPGIDIPVWKIPCQSHMVELDTSMPDFLYSFEDWDQNTNLVDTDTDGLARCKQLLIKALDEEKAPPEQYGRLRLK